MDDATIKAIRDHINGWYYEGEVAYLIRWEGKTLVTVGDTFCAESIELIRTDLAEWFPGVELPPGFVRIATDAERQELLEADRERTRELARSF